MLQCVKSFALTFRTTDFAPSADLNSEMMQGSSTAVPLPAECEELYSAEVAKDPRVDQLSLRVKALENASPRTGLTDEDKAFIRDAVKVGIREEAETKMARFKSWSPFGAAVTIALFVLLQWNGYTIFRTHTEDRLDRIEASQREANAVQSPRRVLNEIAGLPPITFKKNLPALLKVTEQKPSVVSPQPSILQTISAKLSTTQPNTPDYWRTVLQFIHFASAATSTNAPPPGEPDLVLRNNENFTTSPISNKRVLLDGGSIVNMVFKNSRITFTGNPVGMQNVLFEDCVFDFPLSDAPSPYIQRASQALLASSLQKASVASLN